MTGRFVFLSERKTIKAESSMKTAGVAILFLCGLLPTPSLAADDTRTLLVEPFHFFDTSGEPRDQRAEHAARLATLTTDLDKSLRSKQHYRIVAPPTGAAPCPEGDSDCLLNQARSAGADVVIAGAIQKISSMASNMWIGAFDAKSGKRLLFRQITFRGDTDESWRRASAFLNSEIEEGLPKDASTE
jgi:hypothetical protein